MKVGAYMCGWVGVYVEVCWCESVCAFVYSCHGLIIIGVCVCCDQGRIYRMCVCVCVLTKV